MKRVRSRLNIVLWVSLVLVLGSVVVRAADRAELVIRGGKIVTMDDRKPLVEALALAQGRILAAGPLSQITPLIGPQTRVIQLKGELVIPGIIESHGHFGYLGRAKTQLDLSNVQNWDEVIQMVAEAVKKARPGEWIQGRGWHQEKWNRLPAETVEGMPVHAGVSAVSPDNPVFLAHASGHAVFANQKAMTLAGLDENTQPPAGGEIVHDANGKPTGILKENAEELINKALHADMARMTPAEKEALQLKELALAQQACLENGITSFHDAGVPFSQVDLYKQLAEQGRLTVRLNVMLSEPNANLNGNIQKYRLIGYGDSFLTVRSIKRLIDGALGSHGAWLLEPYDSLPGNTGLNTESLEAMKETARIAIENGFQVCTHAIGDRANRETLNIYEEAFKSHPDQTDLRWRIEHAQHIHPEDVPRFAQLGVLAAMQGIHCTSDGPWVAKRLGEKRTASTSYLWRSLIDSGARISNGTDVPVEDVNPIACYHASVTRKMKNGQIFYGAQRMTRMEALRSYTINGAYAAFEEDIKGSLVPGKLADITILSKDILTVPEEDILKATTLYTIVGGKVLYEKKK